MWIWRLSLSKLSILKEGVHVRGERFVISKKLCKNVLQAANQGHLGMDSKGCLRIGVRNPTPPPPLESVQN